MRFVLTGQGTVLSFAGPPITRQHLFEILPFPSLTFLKATCFSVAPEFRNTG